MFWTACKLFFVMTLLTGGLYPLLMTEITTLTMPYHAYGSLIFQNGQLRGSELIAQPFLENHYFWPRPSANDYHPLPSQGSQLGPTSLLLKKTVEQRAQQLAHHHSSSVSSIPTDLLYTSASGLDPHISPEAAYFQLDRVARSRSLSPQDKERLRQVIDERIEGKIGLFGPPYLNVLQLNKQIDQQFPFHF